MLYRRSLMSLALSFALTSGCDKPKDDGGADRRTAVADAPKAGAETPKVGAETPTPKAASEGPPTPKMPASWKVTKDTFFARADVATVAAKLGGEMTGLRNTIFDVGGKTVQVNTLVAKDAAEVGRLMAKLSTTKPPEFFLAKGLNIYEFMGKDLAIPEMRAGRAHLAGDAAVETTAGKGSSSDRGVDAATAWLRKIDEGRYDQAWDAAAPVLKSAADKTAFTTAVAGVRKPFGALISRKLTSTTRAKTLPGMPDGDYLIILYQTSFANKKSAVETITPMLSSDEWLVSGYYIR